MLVDCCLGIDGLLCLAQFFFFFLGGGVCGLQLFVGPACCEGFGGLLSGCWWIALWVLVDCSVGRCMSFTVRQAWVYCFLECLSQLDPLSTGYSCPVPVKD